MTVAEVHTSGTDVLSGAGLAGGDTRLMGQWFLKSRRLPRRHQSNDSTRSHCVFIPD